MLDLIDWWTTVLFRNAKWSVIDNSSFEVTSPQSVNIASGYPQISKDNVTWVLCYVLHVCTVENLQMLLSSELRVSFNYAVHIRYIHVDYWSSVCNLLIRWMTLFLLQS